MKVLLGENFPLPLYHRLRAAGHDAEHIIVLGQRGIPDSAIRQRLMAEELVFLTNDTEFEDLPADYRAQVAAASDDETRRDMVRRARRVPQDEARGTAFRFARDRRDNRVDDSRESVGRGRRSRRD